jgi:uncharacterized OB-fold protein
MEDVAPLINNLNAPFWKAAAEQRLELPFCLTTGRSFWPPSLFSPFATGGTVAWRSVSPFGKVIAEVVYKRSYLKAFDGLMPYGIALVELSSGPRLQAFVREAGNGASLKQGDTVRLFFKKWLGEGDILTAELYVQAKSEEEV